MLQMLNVPESLQRLIFEHVLIPELENLEALGCDNGCPEQARVNLSRVKEIVDQIQGFETYCSRAEEIQARIKKASANFEP